MKRAAVVVPIVLLLGLGVWAARMNQLRSAPTTNGWVDLSNDRVTVSISPGPIGPYICWMDTSTSVVVVSEGTRAIAVTSCEDARRLSELLGELQHLRERNALLEHNEQLDRTYRRYLVERGLTDRIEHVPAR